MLYRIIRIEPQPDLVLRLIYADGETVDVDFAPLVARGGVFAALADPVLFEQVQVGECGRYIEWPGEIDFCADALRLGTGAAAQM